jgi:hypothetical protein
LSQGVDIWRFVVLAAIATKVASAKVIGHNQHHAARRRTAQGAAERQNHQIHVCFSMPRRNARSLAR